MLPPLRASSLFLLFHPPTLTSKERALFVLKKNQSGNNSWLTFLSIPLLNSSLHPVSSKLSVLQPLLIAVNTLYNSLSSLILISQLPLFFLRKGIMAQNKAVYWKSQAWSQPQQAI